MSWFYLSDLNMTREGKINLPIELRQTLKINRKRIIKGFVLVQDTSEPQLSTGETRVRRGES